MQKSIELLIALGPLPPASLADASALKEFERQLAAVQSPVTDEEAGALTKLFGPDDCFGLAWTLLHLVESAPGWPIKDVLAEMQGKWGDVLRERLE